MNSLRSRLILAASLVLTVFIFVAGYALDRAFYQTAETSLQENLNTQLTLLLAGTELDKNNDIDMPSRLLETKFSLPSSGLYAIILDAQGKTLWKSLSTVGAALPTPQILPPGEQELKMVERAGEQFYMKSYGILWYTETSNIPMTFNLFTELKDFNEQIAGYRRTLWGWLIGMAALLLVVQVAILFWGLKPLRRVIGELNAIENGQQDRITQRYPTEILRLTDNINGLLQHEHTQQTRYRNALADLAHSLKTPLAVLSGAVNELDGENKNQLGEQVQRMDHIIVHQLQRAAAAGSSPIRKRVKVKPLLEKISRALNKVYQDKQIQIDLNLPEDLRVRADEGDLMEVAGNIMENACKWCRQRITVSVILQGNLATFTITDDGPGIKPSEFDRILQRGGRIDQAMPGQGIGLSVVMDILLTYESKLSMTSTESGGAAFSFELPAV